MAVGQNLLEIFRKIFGPNRPFPLSWPRLQYWCLFFLALTVLIMLCLKGGHWGHLGSHPFLLFGPFSSQGQLSIPAGGFMLLWAATFFASWVLFFTIPRELSPVVSAGIIFLSALFCRFELFSHLPSSDVYRYLWEGRLIVKGFNPYHLAPNNPLLAHLAAADPFFSKINHPEFTAIYPPFFLYVMAFLTMISDTIMGIKVLILCMDMAVILLIMKLLHQRGYDLRWAVLYAFNPIALYAFTGQGHLDVFQNFFLLLALVFYDRRRWGLMFAALGLAIQSKYMALITIPFFIRRENWPYLICLLAVTLAPFIPLMQGRPERFFTSLLSFSQNFAFNGPIHGLLRLITKDISLAARICQIFFIVLFFGGLIVSHPARKYPFKDDPLPGCFFAFTLLLLLSPTVHFWYLSWGLIFLPFRFNLAWMVLSLTCCAYFAAPANQLATGKFFLPAAYQVVGWGIPGCLFLLALARFPAKLRSVRLHQPVKTVSVVIPTLNEFRFIHNCLNKLSNDSDVTEIIVVDGGSTDHTIDEAKRAGVHVLVHDKPPEESGGRGGQIIQGVHAAKGDIVAVVHADTMVGVPQFRSVINYLNAQPMVIGGALGSIFDASAFGFRLLELANDMRAVITGISFGDQVQFFRRRAVLSTGLYPDQPLMEDIELSLRLRKSGQLVYFFGSCRVSSRKWERVGYVQVSRILRLFISYLWRRLWSTPDTLKMYRQYYKKSD